VESFSISLTEVILLGTGIKSKDGKKVWDYIGSFGSLMN